MLGPGPHPSIRRGEIHYRSPAEVIHITPSSNFKRLSIPPPLSPISEESEVQSQHLYPEVLIRPSLEQLSEMSHDEIVSSHDVLVAPLESHILQESSVTCPVVSQS